MRGLALLLLSGAGCNGDEGTDATGDTDPAADTDGGDPLDPCGAIPDYDLDTMSCSQLVVAWDDAIDAADSCLVEEDCEAFHPDCTRWNGVGCWYAANKCAAEMVAEFGGRIAEIDCSDTNAECVCGGKPPVDCVSGRCVLVYGSY